MSLTTGVVVLFAVFNLLGGLVGYLKAGSRASLIAGSVAGVVLLACAFGIQQGNRPVSIAAAIAAMIVAGLLGGRFIGTWFKTRRLMPDLVMVAFSVIALFTLWRWLAAIG